MNTSDCLVDIAYNMGVCLGATEGFPESLSALGEGLLRAPGVAGVVVAVWEEESPTPLFQVGQLPGDAQALVDVARGLPWKADCEGAASAELPGFPGVVAIPLGDRAAPTGVLLVQVVEPDRRLTHLLEGVGAGLTGALRRRQLSREVERLESSMQDQISRMGELAAVSQLAASVAHELRNPLSSIKGAAQYLRNEYDDHGTVREFLDIIIEEVGVLNRITSEFLDFARPMHLDLTEGHLHDAIRKVLQVTRPQMAAQGIEVVLDLGAEVPTTLFDEPQVERALRNLIVNAMQAMPEGGVITIRTRLLTAPLPAVALSVSDTGRGIAAEELNRLFTPFFTTKTKGIGLGLTIVQKVAQNHGGSIMVESQVGAGCTFTMRLPSVPGAENLRAGA